MIGMDVKLAVASLKSAKLKAFLTMFAVVVGVMLFVIVSAAIEGLKASATEDINALGGNLVTVNSGKILTENEDGSTSINFAASFGASTLTERDFNDIRDVEGVKAAAPQIIISGSVKRGDNVLNSALINATNADYPEAFSQEVVEGQFFNDDLEGRFTVIGQTVKEKLFEGGNPLGAKLTIRGVEFTVLGVMQEFEAAFSLGVDLNNQVLIDFDAGKEITGGPLLIQEIDIQLEDGTDVNTYVEEIEGILLENHNGEEDFTVLKQEQLVELTDEILGVIDTVAKFMPYILLFVGAVVILLIMRITVTERTREIGIRKSIGATNGNVLTQFLSEAIVISLFGSLFGIALAWAVGLIVTWLTDFSFVYNLNTLLAVVVIGTIIGALAGFFPAWEAARKDPVEALRHE